MDRSGKFPDDLNGLGEGYVGQDEAEVELAFHVHRSEPGDLSLISLLVERYADDVAHLSNVLLQVSGIHISLESAIQTVVIRTFVFAIHHTDRFRGKSNLLNWLLGITISQTIHYLRERKRRSPYGDEDASFDIDGKENWARFDNLPEKLRLVLILRYACGLTIEDIAETLGVKLNQAHAWLTSGRRKLMAVPLISHRVDQLEAYVDGLLAEDLNLRNALESHLPECETCDACLAQLRTTDQQLQENMQVRWPKVTMTSEKYESLVHMIRENIPQRVAWRLSALPLRQAAWLGGLFLLFTITVFVMIINQPQESEFSPHPTATPTVISMGEVIQKPANNNIEEGLNVPSFTGITYDMSNDADHIVVVSSNYDLSASTLVGASQKIYLYNRSAEEFIEVSSDPTITSNGAWHTSPPSLSMDGRFVVYAQAQTPVKDVGEFCKHVDGGSCNDIFVYDSQNGLTEQITHGFDGMPANGTSLAPSISADGRWVAFWSLARNLTVDGKEGCDINNEPSHCLDVYLYDRQDGQFSRIPVGSSLFAEYPSPDRISISADGSLLAFTSHEGDLLYNEFGLSSQGKAVIYNHGKNTYEIVNRGLDGSQGTGASSGAVLTPDGRFVAFTSLASNLVEGDNNGSFDVFVLDRENGSIEQVSVNTVGIEGNGDSGVFIEGTGFHSLEMSSDGRFVTFLSEATNLGDHGVCNTEPQMLCKAVILHDRQTGLSQVIRSMDTNHLYLFLDVSDNGRWVTYLDVLQQCTQENNECMELVIYDRERNWTDNLIEKLFHFDKINWQRGQPIQASEDDVNVLAASPEGTLLAAAYGNNKIGLWDFSEQRWVRTMEVKTEGAIISLAFDSAGEWLAAGTMDGVVKLWQIHGRSYYELRDHPGRVHSVIFSPDGNDLLVGTPDELWVWRKTDKKIVLAYKLEYPSQTNEIALSPSGNLLAVANSDQTVWLQLLPSGSLITRLGGQENVVSKVTFSSDGSLLATKAKSGEVNLWKIDWKGFGTLNTQFVSSTNATNWFGNMVFSPDGRYLATGSYFEGIELWNTTDGRHKNLNTSEVSQEIIKAVAFTPDGATIFGGSYGKLSTWFTSLKVTEPRFFQRSVTNDFTQPASDGLAPADDWPNVLLSTGDAGRHLDLYEADKYLSFKLVVPTSLPEQVHFIEAQLLDDGGVALHYSVDNLPYASKLIVIENPFHDYQTSMQVGQDASVEEEKLDAIYAEYLAGDWRIVESEQSGRSPIETWQWDNDQPVNRLRWYDSTNQTFIYILYQEQAFESTLGVAGKLDSPVLVGDQQVNHGIDKEQLLQIARGMEALPDYTLSNTIYVSYQIQEGDTCFGIANWFGTSIEELIRVNETLGDCSLIHTGEVIIVPLNTLRLDVAHIDLDCDSKPERLQIIPALDAIEQPLAYGIYLQDMSDLGLYWDVWQMTTRREGADYLSYPSIIDLGECRFFLTLQVEGGEKPGLRVLHLVNGQMKMVLNQGRKILTSDASTGTIKVFEQEIDSASGLCQAWEVTYRWDGGEFVEVERVDSHCGN